MGNHGHVPRDILPAGATFQANKANELSVGTTKVTSHIPGYNGFIPQTDINALAGKQSVGQDVRNTIIK
jgi:hypothetical protein